MAKKILLILVEIQVYDSAVRTGVQCRIAELEDFDIAILQKAQFERCYTEELGLIIDGSIALKFTEMPKLGEFGKMDGVYVFERFCCSDDIAVEKYNRKDLQ